MAHCKNLCERLAAPRIFSNLGMYRFLDLKYCRRCECWYHDFPKNFCPCCGMQLRLHSTSKRYRQIVREKIIKRI